MRYVLRAVDRAGKVGFYTGKAGPEWVSNQAAKAFQYEHQGHARTRAAQFNTMSEVHGLWFIAIPASPTA